jgi:hypothetical protein
MNNSDLTKKTLHIEENFVVFVLFVVKFLPALGRQLTSTPKSCRQPH